MARSRASMLLSMRDSTASTAEWHDATTRAPWGVREAVRTFPCVA